MAFMQTHLRLVFYAYVIMENHLHLVVSSDNLSKELGDFKSFTARQIIDHHTRNNAKPILEALICEKIGIKRAGRISFGRRGVIHNRYKHGK
jgi:putative transposase